MMMSDDTWVLFMGLVLLFFLSLGLSYDIRPLRGRVSLSLSHLESSSSSLAVLARTSGHLDTFFSPIMQAY